MADGLVAFLRDRLAEDQAKLDEEVADHERWASRSDDELHWRGRHPAYEYKTTRGQRKAWPEVDDPPEPDAGWELNRTSYSPDAFERFDYHEEREWRRLLPDGQREDAGLPAEVRRGLAEVDAKRRILDAWPDSFGLWSADQADAAKTMKAAVLLLLARPYAAHPDFRPEWAVERPEEQA